MNQFLLVYDRARTQLLEEREFTEKASALAARFDAEERYREDGENIEIVVLGAHSRDQLMRTHSRYFLSWEELNRQAD